jgi:polyisoprenoid-binding protein YceI
MTSRRTRWLIAVPVVLVALVVVGPWLYINVLRDDPPDRLSFDDATSTTTEADGTTTIERPTTTEAEGDTGVPDDSDDPDLDGTWGVVEGSQVGYRIPEILFGQSTEGVGRTSEVTGEVVIDGATISDASFVADMASVASDEERRDGQFRGRLMDVANHPEGTFTLTEPIELASIPDDLEQITVSATGDLTLRGTTNQVTFDLTARRNGEAFEVNGSIPLTFADYGIPDPSAGPAQVGETGELEVLLVFER